MTNEPTPQHAAGNPPTVLTHAPADEPGASSAATARTIPSDADAMRDHGALTMLGQIAARTAHEINNPLAGIQNAFLLLRSSIPDSHSHYHFVGAIEREIGRIAAVTRQLYETYRPDHAMDTQSSLAHAIGDAASFVEATSRGRQVRLRASLVGAPPRVPVPDALLRQALYNILQNAVEHTPDGGDVEVTATTEDDWCVVVVRDRGPGFPADLRASLSAPYPGHTAFARRAGGKGIGLMLVRQSVHAVGGHLTVRDRKDGPGSAVEIRLPMMSMTSVQIEQGGQRAQREQPERRDGRESGGHVTSDGSFRAFDSPAHSAVSTPTATSVVPHQPPSRAATGEMR